MSSYNRQTQSKAQNEANARTLRALVKQPENKVCADCKRNDPRWASWNIGCFLCIRCSGIHRSMGTHISKVKSIDLDIWTPEQMASVQQWGNKRCNLYWEAHLKAGHIPPEHKVESFIRSKYETKRWAMDGPVPEDPSTLEENGTETVRPAASTSSTVVASSVTTTAPAANKGTRQTTTAIDLLGGDAGPGTATTSVTKARTSGGSLLDDAPSSVSTTRATMTTSPPTSNIKQSGRGSTMEQANAVKASTGGGGGGLFDLDWHSGPTSPTSMTAAAPKGNKSDILSLYSATSPRQSVPSNAAGLDAFGSMSLSSGVPAASDPWAQRGPTSPTQSMIPTKQSSNLFSTQDVWGSNTAAASTMPTANSAAPSNDLWGDMMSGSTNNSGGNNAKSQTTQQNDAFADIWK